MKKDAELPGVSKPEPAKNHASGHRDRLRGRFRKAGVDGVQDYELLELILFRAIPRRDVKPLAKDLLARFGGFAEVCAADFARLTEIKGVSEAVATEIKIVHAASLMLLQQKVVGKTYISSWSELNAYVRAAMAYEKREQFRVLFLDKKNVLIADEVQQTGTVDHTPVYPREVVKRALDLGASAIILLHNHPSGDPTPSRADIEMTKTIADAASHLGIKLHDHLIVGRDGVASFRSLELL